jgi:hypothetical protein
LAYFVFRDLLYKEGLFITAITQFTKPCAGVARIAKTLAPNSRSRFSRLIMRTADFGSADHSTSASRRAFYHSFLRWLCLKIEEQVFDINELLADLGHADAERLWQWLIDGRYASLVPEWARPEERELFVADFRLVLEILNRPEAARGVDRG